MVDMDAQGVRSRKAYAAGVDSGSPDLSTSFHAEHAFPHDVKAHASSAPLSLRFQSRRSIAVLYGCVALLYLFVFRNVASPQQRQHSSPARSVHSFAARQSHSFVDMWKRHMMAHPVASSDRIGFAEMGLRARVYSQLLESQSVDIADSLEASLWPFVPALKQMRSAHFGAVSSTTDASSANDSGQEQRTAAVRPTSVRSNERRRQTVDDSHVAIASLADPAHTGRGIVMSLGRSEVRFAMHFLTSLRNVHHSNLPVELYYYGENDLPLFMRDFLEQTYSNVRTIDMEALDLFDSEVTRLAAQGWALKPFTLLATNLTEVMLCDADVVFLTRPDDFFEVKGYEETGTLFFHDRDHFREGASLIIHDFLKQQLGTRGPSDTLRSNAFWQRRGIYEQESGVVVVNKGSRDVFAALLLAAWQNSGGIRERTTYRVFWGDKESYWLAFELADFPYYFVDHYAGGIGTVGQDQFCSDHPLHFLPAEGDGDAIDSTGKQPNHNRKLGRPAWFNGSLLASKGQSDVQFLNSTAWAVGGAWEFEEELERWCMPKHAYSGEHFGGTTKHVVADMIAKAREADETFAQIVAS